MEKIKKALEKARTDREKIASVGKKPEKISQKAGIPAEQDFSSIVYTQTKVIKVPRKLQIKNHLISSMSSGPEMDAYKVLRSGVTRILKANKWNSLAITSARPGEGKSLTSINLAIAMAREVNHTVMLVDFDLRKPGLHKYFGYCPRYGLSEIVRGTAVVEDVLVNPGIKRLVLLPGKDAISNSSETLSSPKIVNMVREIKSRYPERYIIFDLPPVLDMDDALVFSEFVDAYLLVVEDGRTKQDDLNRVFDMLASVNVIGTVLNKSDEPYKKNYQYKESWKEKFIS